MCRRQPLINDVRWLHADDLARPRQSHVFRVVLFINDPDIRQALEEFRQSLQASSLDVVQDDHTPVLRLDLRKTPLDPALGVLPVAWHAVPKDGAKLMREQVGDCRPAEQMPPD